METDILKIFSNKQKLKSIEDSIFSVKSLIDLSEDRPEYVNDRIELILELKELEEEQIQLKSILF